MFTKWIKRTIGIIGSSLLLFSNLFVSNTEAKSDSESLKIRGQDKEKSSYPQIVLKHAKEIFDNDMGIFGHWSHQSHQSHYSHSSHASHYSHYSHYSGW